MREDVGGVVDERQLEEHALAMLNGFAWRDVIEDLGGSRRCIAPDLMAFGHTDVAGEQDLSFKGQARMLAGCLDTLKVDKVDLVENDSGGGVSELFAANYPSRVQTLTLTNCEVHDLWPNPTLQQLFDRLTQEGALAGLKMIAADPAAARAAFSAAYEDAGRIAHEAFRIYLEPVLATKRRTDILRRFLQEVQNDRAQLVSAAPQLKQLRAPVQVIWGDADVFFDMGPSLSWLRQNIPAIRKVITVPRAKLFFP
jgi:pimeloyl-ACP methyl ester carboxylesterase